MNAKLDIQAAIALLHKEGHQYSRRLALSVGVVALGLVFFLLGTPSAHSRHSIDLFPLMASLVCILTAAGLAPRSRSKAMESLAALEDVRAIGPLVSALPSAVGEKHRAIVRLLARLLERLQPADRDLLTGAHRRLLVDTLRSAYITDEAEFTIALIHGLDRLGAGDAADAVERFLSFAVTNEKERRIVDAAAAALPSLLIHASREKQSRTLLHPASATQSPTLLRAAHPELTPSDELLRANAADPPY